MIGSDTILVVDDDPHFRDLVRDLLEQAGYRVVTLGDGAAAVEAAADERPAAVVLDVNLPRLNGYEVCHWPASAASRGAGRTATATATALPRRRAGSTP
jgi:DNA-binding response OmpR family regulator